MVPDCARVALRPLVGQIGALDEAIGAIDRELAASVKADETARQLMTIPGVGPVTASAIVATIQDAGAFASGREFAAFLGLTPRQNSTGGKTRLGRITKMGDRYLRKLLVVGACATLRHRKGHNDALRLWASGMLERPKRRSARESSITPPSEDSRPPSNAAVDFLPSMAGNENSGIVSSVMAN